MGTSDYPTHEEVMGGYDRLIENTQRLIAQLEAERVRMREETARVREMLVPQVRRPDFCGAIEMVGIKRAAQMMREAE